MGAPSWSAPRPRAGSRRSPRRSRTDSSPTSRSPWRRRSRCSACGLAVQGSLVAGFGAGAVGIAFLGIGLVAGQLQRTSRGANSLSVWVLLVTFLLAGHRQRRRYAERRPAAHREFVARLAVAVRVGRAEPSVRRRRRLAAPAVRRGRRRARGGGVRPAVRRATSVRGLIPERHGRATASPALSSPSALVARLTSGAVIGWIVGGLITGMLATSLATVLESLTEQLPSVEAILQSLTDQGSLAQGAVVIFFTMAGIFGACCAVQIVCHARQEEAHGTAEPVLSTPVDRARWLADYMVVALVAVILVIAAAVAGAAIGLASSAGDWSLLGDAVVVGAGQVAGRMRLPRRHGARLRPGAAADDSARLDARGRRDGAGTLRTALRPPRRPRAHLAVRLRPDRVAGRHRCARALVDRRRSGARRRCRAWP